MLAVQAAGARTWPARGCCAGAIVWLACAHTLGHKAHVCTSPCWQLHCDGRQLAFYALQCMRNPTPQLAPLVVCCPCRWPREFEGTAFPDYLGWMALAYVVSLLDAPAISIPCGLTHAGAAIAARAQCPLRSTTACARWRCLSPSVLCACTRQQAVLNVGGGAYAGCWQRSRLTRSPLPLQHLVGAAAVPHCHLCSQLMRSQSLHCHAYCLQDCQSVCK